MPKVVLGVKLYSTEEVADMLGITKATLSKYSSSKKIESATIGRKKYYSEENIKAFLNNREQSAN